MGIEPLLFDLLITLGLALVVLYIGLRFRIPGVVAFLLTGVVVGPNVLGLIRDTAAIELLAEIGVILLLFTIGMQFSFRTLFSMRRIVFLGGALQVGLTVGAVAALAWLGGYAPGIAIFFGLLVCHSSTTVALRVFQERGEVDSPHGQSTLGISLFQDVMSVPMLLMLPLLAGQEARLGGALLTMGVSLAVLLLLVAFLATYLVPRLMNRVTATRSSEVFLIAVVLICLAITWFTSSIGLSLALGAFLAGLTLAESEYFHQAFVTVLPFRDIFTSFFFISVGMLLDPGAIVAQPLLALGLIAGALVLKAVVAAIAALAVGNALQTAARVGSGLANIGEFGLILALAGEPFGLFPGRSMPLFLVVAVSTMAVAPFAIMAGPRLGDQVVRLPLPRFLRAGEEPPGEEDAPGLRDHLVIVGYGQSGRTLARAAAIGGIPFVAIDLNPETVARERAAGTSIFFGDATAPAILEHAGIGEARVLAVVISDNRAIRAITTLAHRMNPGIRIIVRTRFISDVGQLHDLGADEVIPEEFETSIEVFTRVLATYHVPKDTIERFTRDVRAALYEPLRSTVPPAADLHELARQLPQQELATLDLAPTSPAAGQSLADLDLRRTLGVSALAVLRGGESYPNPSGELVLAPGDHLIVLGTAEQILEANRLLAPVSEELP